MEEIKWIVNIHGDRETGHEISIVRSDYPHGIESWGWFNEWKKRVSSCDHHEIPVRVWDAIVKAAEEEAADLNKRNVGLEPVVNDGPDWAAQLNEVFEELNRERKRLDHNIMFPEHPIPSPDTLEGEENDTA